jgi:hypothetical protein
MFLLIRIRVSFVLRASSEAVQADASSFKSVLLLINSHYELYIYGFLWNT